MCLRVYVRKYLGEILMIGELFPVVTGKMG